MKIAITPSNQDYIVVIFDTETEEMEYIEKKNDMWSEVDWEKYKKPSHRPFGITWDDNKIYLGNNKKLLEFGKGFKSYKVKSNGLYVNTHTLTVDEGNNYILCCSTAIDRITFARIFGGPLKNFNLKTNKFDTKMFRGEYTDKDKRFPMDTFHHNFLLQNQGKLYVNIHNRGDQSKIRVYSYPDMEWIEDLGWLNEVRQSHGIAIKDDLVYTIDTGNHRLICSNRKVIPYSEHHFGRGLVLGEEEGFFSYCNYSARVQNNTDDCYLQGFTPDMKETRKFTLPEIGAVNDMKILDEFDYTHYRKPIW